MLPDIRTERLLLRRHRLDDFAAAFAMWSDPQVTRYISGTPSSEQQVWSRILTYAGHWALLDFGFWAVEEAHSGSFVGEAGFANFKRDIEPEMRDVPEIGWVFAPHAHGKGFATETVRAIVAWGDERFDTARTVCLINPDNAASIRVAEKCGYHQFRHTRFNGAPVLFFERDRALS